jgi:hypothetical protein
MNIFFLHVVAKQNAALYVNKHCIKIILEITQMLYSAYFTKANISKNWSNLHERQLGLSMYRQASKNHPMTLWVRQHPEHFKYAVDIGLALTEEYSRRYGGRIHACTPRLQWIRSNLPIFGPCAEDDEDDTINFGEHITLLVIPTEAGQLTTKVPLCMPPQYFMEDAIASYRAYYIDQKMLLLGAKDPMNKEDYLKLWKN